MFNFIKKEKSDRDEKERRKREKKLRKEAKQGVPGGSMSTEELLRLDEVRRSLKIRGRRKEKEKLPSGITADYSAEFFAQLDIDRGVEMDRGTEEVLATANTTIDNNGYSHRQIAYNISQSDSSENSLQSLKSRLLPPVPPKPPKRGILKGPRINVASTIEESSNIPSPDSSSILMRNTLQNEVIAYHNIPLKGFAADHLKCDVGENLHGTSMMNALHIITSPSPSAESLTDTTTNSSFATPPFSLSPVGESQGLHRWSRVQAFEELSLPLPPIKLVNLPAPRELVIKRQKTPRNDFGFSLRKAICLDRSASLFSPVFRPVIFAEPGAQGNATGLLPGDRLIKVNGISVEDLPRETIIEMIRNSGESVTVQVQPVGELVELSRRCMTNSGDETDRVGTSVSNCNTLRRSASKRFKTETKIEGDDGPWTTTNGESVWLVHRGGFCAATRFLQKNPGESSGKVLIELQHSGEQLHVDEDDIEKANPSKLDLVEDICQLKHLNEASVLHCLRQRYASNLIHTKAGPTLMVVNPMAPLSLYSEKVVSMFRGCKTEDMPPHVYSLAQTAYRTMLETRRDQSLIFMGRSGSGKTTSFKHALYYLALAAGSVNKLLTAEKVNAINTILEAFGNAKTCMNSNATRFTQILSLDFDHSGQIASASVQVLLLERTRCGRRIGNDCTFHVLTRLLAGAEGSLQKELHLDNVSSDESNPFIQLPQKLEDRQKASSEFVRLVQAFSMINVEASSVKALWHVLAAIYHLGVAGVTKIGVGATARTQFANPSAARRAATLLGISMEDLTSAAFQSGSSSPARSPTDSADASWDGLEALIVGLYSETMAAVVSLVNKAISTSAHTIASILLLDSPGFQNPASCGQQSGATLSDLRHNYLQERLQLLFHHVTLVAPQDRYAQELVELGSEGVPESNPAQLVSLIDKAPQSHVVRTSQRDLREQDRRGLLWLLDEESIYPNSNDDTFYERLFNHYGDREHQNLLRRAGGSRQFILQHLQGTNPVLYSANGWLKASKEHPATKAATMLLQDSSKEDISRLFISAFGRGNGAVFCGSIAGMEGSQSLRRVSSIRRSFTTAGVKRNSLMLQVKFTVDGIVDTFRRTGTHFVHCFMLQHNAGTSTGSSQTSPQHTSEDIVNIPLVRSQLRGSQILEAARLHRLGFPESVPLHEFIRRFGLLGDPQVKDQTVEQILSSNEIDPSAYRIGPSQVLFRSGVLGQLEAKRDELLSDRIIQFQAYCRGYLARRRVAQRRVQELAVRCIQRNVRAFLTVRDWPWWRLLVRVTPLLNVHRTEEQLKAANDELQMLKAKLDKIETERATLKAENEKLEAKSQKINGIPPSPRFHLPVGLSAIGEAQRRYNGEEISAPRRIAIRPMQPVKAIVPSINGGLENGTKATSRPPLPQIRVPRILSPTLGLPPPGKVRGMPAKNGFLEPSPKTLNPNYRPLENGMGVKKQRPLEATLTVPLTPSTSCGSLSRDSSCVSLTLSRSPSPCSTRSGVSSRSSYGADSSISRASPRRVFPQSYSGGGDRSLNEREFKNLEQSPVVFDANMSFVLGCTKQSVRQSFRPSPAHTDSATASNYLSTRIEDFLKRTDHVMEEWAALGKKSSFDDDTISLIERQRERNRDMNGVGRSRSVTNIMIKGYQLLKSDKLPPTSSRSNSVTRDFSDSDTIIDDGELSDMTVDLAEERSTANLVSERLEAEAAERLKLEKELQEQQGKIRTLQESSEKLEMELICAKSDLNGISEDEDGDNDEGAGGVYKLKYERVARELEFTKRRLQTQHEHDLEQLVGLKKQLEKKLADAYEEVEEQRQVVGQWKRKAQKMTNEMNDLRMLLDEQNSRNNLLEKRQRKFDSECQSLQEGARQEKQSKDRLAREKDILIAEKFTLEQNLADTRLELELKEEKLSSLQRELEEMTFGGGTEEEVAQLKRSKLELERRNKEQEEELDEMAGQVQLLEQAKLRLEMTLETMRKEARREAQQRDDELEEARGASYKKIKALECQLETEHEERTLLLREKHELERRLAAAAEQDRADRAAEESAIQKLKRDLRKYKALLKDAQSQLDRAKADSPGKVLIRQLRNQIEDAEAARTIAVKSRQTAEAELSDVQTLLEETQRLKSDAEDKASQAHRDRSELQAQIEENEEEMAELMKKYTSTVKQLNTEQMASSEYEIKISELEAEKNSLKEQIAELTARVENVENMSDPSASVITKRLELRTKELESKLDLEQATKARVEVQCNRHKEALEKLQQEMNLVRAKELQSQESLKKTQKNLRELREELQTVANREQESMIKRKDVEKRLEAAESECTSAKNDLRLALLRISDLQTAMEEGDEDPTDSDQDSDSSDDSLSDLEQRLNPIRPRLTSRIAAKETNGVADDALVIREGKSDNGPRISVALSPSSSSSHGNGDTSYA